MKSDDMGIVDAQGRFESQTEVALTVRKSGRFNGRFPYFPSVDDEPNSRTADGFTVRGQDFPDHSGRLSLWSA
jgi:hypothetical protein